MCNRFVIVLDDDGVREGLREMLLESFPDFEVIEYNNEHDFRSGLASLKNVAFFILGIWTKCWVSAAEPKVLPDDFEVTGGRYGSGYRMWRMIRSTQCFVATPVFILEKFSMSSKLFQLEDDAKTFELDYDFRKLFSVLDDELPVQT